MAFVHGHARDLTWVVAHVRRPHRHGAGQLPLPAVLDDVAATGPEQAAGTRPREVAAGVPAPRVSPEDRARTPAGRG